MAVQRGTYVPIVALVVCFGLMAEESESITQKSEESMVCTSASQDDELLEPQEDILNVSAQARIRNARAKEKRADRAAHYPRHKVQDLGNYIGGLGADAIRLNVNLFTWDSFKVITGIFPFYIFSRMVDERLQSMFHDNHHHKNENQFPRWSHDFAEKSIGVPITFFGLSYLTTRNKELRESSRIFLIGFPFVIFGKDLLKSFQWGLSKRPWNEKFDCRRRAFGGFPSGHVAEATYMAVMFGMRYGLRAGVPLGVLAAAIGVTFLNCNRHYLSQMVAGAGLGTLYAIAANKLVDTRLNDQFSFGLSMNERGAPSFALSYQF